MAKTVEAQLSDVGKRLSQSPVNKAALAKILEQAAALYSEIEQSPSESILASMKTSIDSLVQYHMLRHKDDDVRVLVATCLSEILRIVAPEAPYDDEQLKDVFQLIVSTFKGLNKLENPSFLRRVRILEMVAKVRSCVVMLDLECEDLILEMFQAFFSTASEKHTENVVGAMQTIMTLVIDESEDLDENQGGGLPKPLIEELINNLYKSPSVVAHELAENVIKKSEQKLIPYVQHYLKLTLPELSSKKGLSEDSLDMLLQLYGCSPEMVLSVIPVLDEELQMESKETRMKVVDFFGRLFSSLSQPHEEVKQFFIEYIRKFSEKDTEVILSTVKTVKNYLATNNLKEADTRDTLIFLNDRLKDSENRVREQSAEVICEFFLSNPTEVPVDVIMHVADLLRDVMIPLRTYVLRKLTEAYRMFCVKQNMGQDLPSELFEWIPSRIVRCCVDEDCVDFRPQNLELMLTELFPSDITVSERVTHMISMFVFFNPFDEKALGRILSYKQRFQQEMQSYLSLRQRAKGENSPDIFEQMKYCWKKMCSSFLDPENAEEGFERLNQIKDDSIFKSLSALLDASTPFSEIQSIQDGMLQRLGKQPSFLDFMKLLALKCSYVLFNKEHMVSLLGEVTKLQAAVGKQDLFMASISVLKNFSKFFPAVAEGAKEGLLKLMNEENELCKQVAVQVLGNSCAIFLRQQTETNGLVESILGKLCLEGSPMDAKLAVRALVTFAEDSDSSTITDLYEKLVDSLQTSAHLPTVLQSIGCIAEHAGTTMNLRNNEVVQFIKEEVLTRQSKIDHEFDWNAVSGVCMLKVLGLKTITKSLLGRKDADQQHLLLSELFGVLTSLMKRGEELEEADSSELEKAHLRLAAAKCVLRLSRRLDDQIPPQLFHATVLTALDSSARVRFDFLEKVHAHLINRSVSLKYACAFPLSVTNVTEKLLNLVKRYLNDVLEVCQLDVKPEKTDKSKGADALSPEYVLVYLVHVIAHHSLKMPTGAADLSSEDAKTCCMQLLFLLWGLLSGSGEPECLSRIVAIFHSIKLSSDAIDSSRTESLRFICNLGSLILNSIMESNIEFPKDGAIVSLPSDFYKILDSVELQEDDQDQPKCLESANVDSQVKSILTELSLDMHKLLAAKLKSVNVQDATLLAEVSQEGMQSEKHGQSNLTENGNSHSKPVSSSSKSVPSRKRDQRTKVSTKVVDATPDAGAMAIEQAAAPPSALKRKRGGADKAISKAPSPDTRKEAEVEDTLNTSSERRKRPRKVVGKAVEEPAKSVESEKEALPMEIDTKAVETIAASESGQENIPNSPEEADIETKPVTSVKKLKISEETPTEPPPQSVESAGEAEEPHKRANGKKLRKKLEVHNGAAENSATPVPKSPRETPRRAVKMISSKADDKTPGSNGKNKTLDERHIGLRIKVWWPMDRRFYEGVIESYDTVKKRHTVLYNDGDVEVLNFAKQRWELIDSSTAQPGELASSPDRPAETLRTKQDNSSSSTLAVKAKPWEDKKADSSAEKSESLPKRRKRTEVGHLEKTAASKAALEKSAEKPKEDEKSNNAPEKEKDDLKANEKVNRRVTALRSPGRPPAAARSPRKPIIKTPVPPEEIVKSPRRKTQEATLLDGKTSSPVTSKDSDDVPLKAWKSRTRKSH